MNKLFLKGCNSINYRTYNNIKNSLLVSGGLVGVSNIFIMFSGMVNNSYLGYLSSLFYFSYLFLNFSNGERYTKDVNELRNLYNEFIKNYNKMNKEFSFNEPISIYTMFNFLLKNGYLSKDKSFSCEDNKFYNLYAVLGSEVICGNGVCRHISSMLTDILNDYEIPSLNVICYRPLCDFEFLPTTKEEYSRDKNMSIISKYVSSNEEQEKLIEKFVFLEQMEIYLMVRPVSSKFHGRSIEKIGNHLITYAFYDDKSYYLDPTLFSVYRMQDFKKGILCNSSDKNIFLRKDQFYRMNDLSDKEIKEFIRKMELYQDSVSLLEEDKIITRTTDICGNNMDIFDKFYNDNHELYREIENKLVKIKRKKN